MTYHSDDDGGERDFMRNLPPLSWPPIHLKVPYEDDIDALGTPGDEKDEEPDEWPGEDD